MTLIKHVYCSTSQRVEIELTNGQVFSLLVNKDTGKVEVLSDHPHMIGHQAINNDGFLTNVLSVKYYGYPSD
jgi:hypothetical protein